VFFWRHWRHLPCEERPELPQRILEQADAIPAGYQLLNIADEGLAGPFPDPSFDGVVCWITTALPKPDAAKDMYFAADLFRLSPDEVIVDCGAFGGDSMQLFLDKTNG